MTMVPSPSSVSIKSNDNIFNDNLYKYTAILMPTYFNMLRLVSQAVSEKAPYSENWWLMVCELSSFTIINK